MNHVVHLPYYVLSSPSSFTPKLSALSLIPRSLRRATGSCGLRPRLRRCRRRLLLRTRALRGAPLRISAPPFRRPRRAPFRLRIRLDAAATAARLRFRLRPPPNALAAAPRHVANRGAARIRGLVVVHAAAIRGAAAAVHRVLHASQVLLQVPAAGDGAIALAALPRVDLQ